MKMAEESNVTKDTDFKKPRVMIFETMKPWNNGAEIAKRSIMEAIDSGTLTLTEEQEKKLRKICSKK